MEIAGRIAVLRWAFTTLAMSLLAFVITLTLEKPVAAQDQNVRYKLVVLSGLGGPGSFLQNGFDGILNNRGQLAGWADKATPDPFPDFCANQDCLVSHAFRWEHGRLQDLGALSSGVSSEAFWISSSGLVTGNSQNGKTDPLVPGFPELRAVLWRNGNIQDLGTLEGGHETIAGAVNDRGEVVGLALNTVPDPYSIIGFGVQARAFLWRNGHMLDLGTLGGPDAAALLINESGQITGFSYIDSTPQPGSGIPAIDPFFWWQGKMYDVGSLGGTFGQPYAMNNRGQVVGTSNLAGDQIYHPFLWEGGVLTDLGTLGGDTGFPNWINDNGVIAGKADLAGVAPQNHDAVIWENGQIVDLGTLPGDVCANAYYVNSHGDVVGTSESDALCRVPTGEHAFVWKEGGPMMDLNTLVPAHPEFELTFAVAINDRGMIAGFGVPSGCAPADVEVCGNAYVLIPCEHDCKDAPTGGTPSPSNAAMQPERPRSLYQALRKPQLRMHPSGGERP
jgi:probable HAF family extracellular repeat protein